MPNSDEKLVRLWEQNLSWAHSKHNAEIKDVCEKNLRFYRGKHWPLLDDKLREGWDVITVNKVFSNIKTILPAINVRNPKVVATARRKPYQDPTTGEQVNTVKQARLIEAVLNYFVQELSLRSEATRVLLDALLMPWGIMKLGYMPAVEKYSTKGEMIELHELIRPGWPFWVRWSPIHFRMDPAADRIENANWVAFYRLMSLDDIKANPNMRVPRGLKANVTLKTNWATGLGNTSVIEGDSDTFSRVGIWEIWDKKKQELIELADQCSKPLRHGEWPYRLDGFPCVQLFFNINPDEQVPIADVSTYLEQQQELNLIETYMLEHIKRHLPVIVLNDSVTEEEQTKLKRAFIGKWIKAGGADVNAVIKVVQGAQLSPDVHAVRKMLSDDLDEISSITELERGTAAKVDTATEAAILQASTTLRRSDRQVTFEEFLAGVVRIFRQILQQTMGSPLDLYLGQDTLTKILGSAATELQQGWLTINPEDIKGEFTESIVVGSSMPINQAQRKADALEKMKIFAMDPLINQRELRKRYFESVDEPDIDTLLLSEQQLMQLQQGMPPPMPGGPPAPAGPQATPQRGLPERLGVGGGGLANALNRIRG